MATAAPGRRVRESGGSGPLSGDTRRFPGANGVATTFRPHETAIPANAVLPQAREARKKVGEVLDPNILGLKKVAWDASVRVEFREHGREKSDTKLRATPEYMLVDVTPEENTLRAGKGTVRGRSWTGSEAGASHPNGWNASSQPAKGEREAAFDKAELMRTAKAKPAALPKGYKGPMAIEAERMAVRRAELAAQEAELERCRALYGAELGDEMYATIVADRRKAKEEAELKAMLTKPRYLKPRRPSKQDVADARALPNYDSDSDYELFPEEEEEEEEEVADEGEEAVEEEEIVSELEVVKQVVRQPIPSDPAALVAMLVPSAGPGDDSFALLQTFCEVFAPLAVASEEAASLRAELWQTLDMNGNGWCSLAEVDGWIQKTLINALKAEDAGNAAWRAFRPSYIRAFNDAKDLDGRVDGMFGDYVTRREFRMLNAYLCLYATMYDAFSRIDGNAEGEWDDRRIGSDEWERGFSALEHYPFKAVAAILDDADQATIEGVFQAMDFDKKGMVLLNEFCRFIEEQETEAGTAIGTLLTVGEEDA